MADTKAGSPIIIDGGGSVSIKFRESWYPPGSDSDEHDHKDGAQLTALKIMDASRAEVDLYPLVKAHPDRCWIKISLKNPSGTIKIKGKPCGVHFKSSQFKKQKSGGQSTYSNAGASLSRVKVHYGSGEGKEIVFDEAVIGKGRVFVDANPPPARRQKK